MVERVRLVRLAILDLGYAGPVSGSDDSGTSSSHLPSRSGKDRRRAVCELLVLTSCPGLPVALGTALLDCGESDCDSTSTAPSSTDCHLCVPSVRGYPVLCDQLV